MAVSGTFDVPVPFATSEDIIALRRRFVGGTLAPYEWTHAAQLAVALGLVRDHGGERARAILTDRLTRWAAQEAKSLAFSQPSLDAQTHDVHHTLVAFLVHGAVRHVASHPRPTDARSDLIGLYKRWGDPELPLSYYSLARLFSNEARDGVVPPDLRPLP